MGISEFPRPLNRKMRGEKRREVNKEKFLDKLALIEVIGILIIAIWIASVNHYRVYYQKAALLSYEEADYKYIKGQVAGYPPGEDIPVAKSVEDIKEYDYCTIEVTKEDIVPTRTFLIKDFSESGDSYSHVGRKHIGSHVVARYGLGKGLLSDILYHTRQIGWNLDEASYGEWCAVTLESGERIYVLVDLMLLDIPSDSKVKLPIGVYISHQSLREESLRIETAGQSEALGVQKENQGWYLDMVGNWEDTEVGDLNPIRRAVGFFVIAFIACCCLEFYIRKHRKE